MSDDSLRDALKQAMYDLGLHLHADRIVDAFLDTLADRADEWDDLAFERCVGDRPGMVGPSDYLAVLRGDTEPKEHK